MIHTGSLGRAKDLVYAVFRFAELLFTYSRHKNAESIWHQLPNMTLK